MTALDARSGGEGAAAEVAAPLGDEEDPQGTEPLQGLDRAGQVGAQDLC